MIKVELEKLLEDKQISLYKLSKDSGVPYPTLFNFLKNKTKGVNFDTIDKICTALDCKVSDLLEFENDNNKPTATA